MFDRVPPEGWLILIFIAIVCSLLGALFGLQHWLDNRKAA